MPASSSAPVRIDDDLAARAAWLHYAGGLTQSAVARRLGLAPTRTHRLIARAARDGLVRIVVDCEVAGCIALEDRLRARFGLSECVVVPDMGDDRALPLAALGRGGSAWLTRVLGSGAHDVIGIGHGRTLSAVVDALPRREAAGRDGSGHGGARAREANGGGPGQAWVSLLGGLTRKFSANPYDVIFRLAEKVGAEAWFLPVPMFADSVEDRRVMLGQTGLTEVMRRIDDASLCLLGIGATDPNETLALGAAGDGPEAQAELRELGVVAELLGQFLDAEGRLVSTPWDGRVMAPALDTLAGRELVAVAGGRHKREAIAAVLRGERLTGLITDERTAQALVEHAL